MVTCFAETNARQHEEQWLMKTSAAKGIPDQARLPQVEEHQRTNELLPGFLIKDCLRKPATTQMLAAFRIWLD